jgi:hypothetical protein
MTPLDPVEEFRSMKVNSRAHAVYWLRTGELHPEIHQIIREKVEPWVARVQAADPAVHERLLREIPPPPREPEPSTSARPLPIAPLVERGYAVQPGFDGHHPPPAAVAEYFRRKRHTIAEFAAEDILHNERLWVLDICGLLESYLDPAPIITRERATRSTPASSAQSTEPDVELLQEKAA